MVPQCGHDLKWSDPIGEKSFDVDVDETLKMLKCVRSCIKVLLGKKGRQQTVAGALSNVQRFRQRTKSALLPLASDTAITSAVAMRS